MRVFMAVDLDSEIKRKIEGIENSLKGKFDIKFVEPENLHVTLKFLGEVSEDAVKEIEESVSGISRDFKEFRLLAKGMGYFGSPSYIRTLWLDFREGKEKLIELCETLNEKLDHIRHEARKPNPHLTIGRVKSGKNKELLLHEIKKLNDVNIGEVSVKEIKLKQSVLTKKGPIYTDLRVFRLGET